MFVCPSSFAIHSMGAPAARPSVTNVCRISFGGGRSRPAAARAGVQTRRRKFERLTMPPAPVPRRVRGREDEEAAIERSR